MALTSKNGAADAAFPPSMALHRRAVARTAGQLLASSGNVSRAKHAGIRKPNKAVDAWSRELFCPRPSVAKQPLARPVLTLLGRGR